MLDSFFFLPGFPLQLFLCPGTDMSRFRGREAPSAESGKQQSGRRKSGRKVRKVAADFYRGKMLLPLRAKSGSRHYILWKVCCHFGRKVAPDLPKKVSVCVLEFHVLKTFMAEKYQSVERRVERVTTAGGGAKKTLIYDRNGGGGRRSWENW